MKQINWQQLTVAEQKSILKRPVMDSDQTITKNVSNIIDAVKEKGDQALIELTERFDNIKLTKLQLDKQTITDACAQIDDSLKEALTIAYQNIYRFHEAQKQDIVHVETMPGIICQQIQRPISRVGLYIPGGTAPLPSTVLMLAIPALIAGCPIRVLTTPPPVRNEIIYAAALCGIETIYTLGGAQAIAAMAFGTESIQKVDKIFGPGNAYVTEAKLQVSQYVDGASIDMPAGPSELFVIADEFANPSFIAADLLSQAEHGHDSQVILATPSAPLIEQVTVELKKQLALLSRKSIAEKALASSVAILTKDLDQATLISNEYAPEHLIIQTENAEQLSENILNAGSIFVGAWSPESVGDYASGTNHVLPTYGFTRTYSSLGLSDFNKRMTIQKLTSEGLLTLAPTVSCIADAEGLDAHKRAVTIRVELLNNLRDKK